MSGAGPGDRHLTRRAALGAAAAGAAALTLPSLPAWAKPARASAQVLRGPDSLPFPRLPAGHESMREIEHVVVLMMENHSFDNLLGLVPHEVPDRRRVDGLTVVNGTLTNANPDAGGQPVLAVHAPSPCQENGAPSQSWNASHTAWDAGANDGFVRASGSAAMWCWDQSDIPFTYSLAGVFPIGERYFSSVLAQTFPNRRFFFCGTASGLIATDARTLFTPAANGTIFDRLNAHDVSYRIYSQDLASILIVPGSGVPSTAYRSFSRFSADAAAGDLPQFTFIDPSYFTTSEEDPQDIQVGEQFIATVVTALMHAPTWKHTALFITYDEHGGYYDHVPPPPAIPPDSIRPKLAPGDAPGAYDRYGFRVPLIVVSPWARRNYVSRLVQDHASLAAFIERKWNLPAMTFRDANAHPMTDYFDLTRAPFKKPPALADAPPLGPGLDACHAQGLNPPLPPGTGSPAAQTDVARYLERFDAAAKHR